MRRFPLLALVVLAACASPAPPRRARHAPSLRASPRAVARCRQAFGAVAAASDPSTAIRELLTNCADLHRARGCREAFRIAADAPPDARLPILAAGCRRAYCPRFSDPRPALCDADVATMRPSEVGPAWAVLERRVLERRLGSVGAAFAEAFARLSAAIVVPIVPDADPAPSQAVVTLVLGLDGDRLLLSKSSDPAGRVTLPANSDHAAVTAAVRPLIEGADRVVLSADRDLPYATIVAVMDAVRAAGVTHFSISVQPSDPSPATLSPAP